jgi:TolB-like protein/DNA-binding winged helix-turn-helix (wHTH) protein/Flp pilus assembly protein TadD
MSDEPNGPLTRGFRLDGWLVQPSLNTVSRGATLVHLRPKVMDVLVLLAAHAGEVVAKETVIDTVWAKKFLADTALSRAVFELRGAFGDEAHGSRYIETIPKRGYRLVPPVEALPEMQPPAEPLQRGRWRLPWRSAVVAAGLAVVAFLLWTTVKPRHHGEASAATVRIVVLPFENVGRAEDDALAAGITDEITGRLASVRGLAVISPSTAVHYAHTNLRTAEIARALAVDYVVNGTVRWAHAGSSAGRVRITPRLVRSADDTQVWADIFDRALGDIFELQSAIARSVVARVGVAMVETAGSPATERPTANLEAYQAYLRGVAQWGMDARSEPNLRLALATFERAAELDANFALALAEAGRVRSVLYHFGFERTEESRARARAAIDRALALDPHSGAVRLASGLHRYWCYKDYEGAFADLSLARATLGATADVLEAQAFVQRRMGRWEEAARLFQQAIDLNQRSWDLAFEAGNTLVFMRRYDLAQRLLERAITLAPDEPDGYGYTAANFLLRDGDVARARKMLEAMPRANQTPAVGYWFRQELCEGRVQAALDRVANGDFTVLENSLSWRPKQLLLAQAYRTLGRAKEARAAFAAARTAAERELHARPDDCRLHSALALNLAGLGRADEAVAAAVRATEMCPLSGDALSGSAALLDLAHVYTDIGKVELACAQLDRLLAVPSQLSVPLLRLDPTWAPLRAQPCYAVLLRRYGG